MVYQNKFVMCVLLNQTPCQELANGTVPIPFGSEYTLRFRNKNARRAVVQFFIDGENVSGDGYMIPSNGFIDIERHADTPNKFKFVSLDSAEAIDFGKNGSNHDKLKGVVEARFFLEREYRPIQQVSKPRPWGGILRSAAARDHGWIAQDGYQNLCESTETATTYNSLGMDTATNYAVPGASLSNAVGASNRSASMDMLDCEEQTRGRVSLQGFGFCAQPASAQPSVNLKDGATVEGDHSHQKFSSVYIDYDKTEYTTVKLFLQGYDPAAGILPTAPISPNPIKRPTVTFTEVVVEREKSVHEAEGDVRRLKEQIAKEKARRAEVLRKASLEAEAARLREELEELQNTPL